MANNKLIAIVAIVVIAVAAVGTAVVLNSDEPEKKGLYKLNPVISDVDMGKCSATPAMIVTIETMYKDYYGELVNNDLTLDDAKADTEFWNKFCNWTSMINKKSDGTIDVQISTTAKGSEIRNIQVSDKAVIVGTMYSEALYYLACAKENVEVYSEESYAKVKEYMSNTIVGGMMYSYFTSEDADYMLKTIDESTYLEVGSNSVQTLDTEKLSTAINEAVKNGKAVYFASGTRMNTVEHYNNNTLPCVAAKEKGVAEYAFFAPTDVDDVFSSVEAIGAIMGFSDEVINKVIEDIQLRLYKVYYSVQEKTDGEVKNKIYWEGSSGKAVSSTMAKVISEFLGFDASLLNGAEHDIESLLVDKPTYLVFYTNDGRTIDDRMRVNN